ncbi:MAG: hypothetical protein L3K04_02665 [Thermoplasmata archaeon]|nr:hypothetical protein [Thermoplasmata archaeon]MCI4341374.1 hypothetical protein [Thermoplasmata archaeon]
MSAGGDGSGEELPDPLGLASAGALVSALIALRWPSFGAVTATFVLLVFASLAIRWMEFAGSRRASAPLLGLLGCAGAAAALYVLYRGPEHSVLLVVPAALAALLGRPGPAGRAARRS